MKNRREILLTIFLWAVISRCGNSGPSLSSDKVTTMYNAIINIVMQCRSNVETIFIHDDHEDSLIDHLSHTSRPFSYFNIDPYKFFKLTAKVDAFILFATDPIDETGTILNNLVYQFTFKQEAPYYIIDKNRPACDEETAELLLSYLMYYGVIESYYICFSPFKRRIFVLTLHSFSQKAPRPWIPLFKIVDEPSTMFFRPYNRDICENFYFDRVRDLDGYTVKVASPFRFDIVKKIPKLLHHFDDRDMDWAIPPVIRMYLQTIMIATKMKINFTLFDVLDRNTIESIYSNCDHDLIMLSNYNHDEHCYNPLYPVHITYLNFMVRHRGYKTPLEKIRDFYGIWTLISMLILSCVTFTVIWLLTKDFSFAGFEILRLYISCGIETTIDSTSKRVFFMMVFLYFLVFHATFNGHLAEFLTHREFRSNPETIDDLDDPRYTKIIGSFRVAKFLFTHRIYEKFEIVSAVQDCVSSLNHSESSVCVASTDELYINIVVFSLMHEQYDKFYHMPKKSFGITSHSFLMNLKSPLRSRFNNILLRGYETGIYGRFKDEEYGPYIIKYKMELEKREVSITPIDLESLKFAFIILATGISLSTIAFIGEIYIHQKRRLRKEKNRKNLTKDSLWNFKKRNMAWIRRRERWQREQKARTVNTWFEMT